MPLLTLATLASHACTLNYVDVGSNKGDSIEDLGLTVGTVDDVRAANDAAIAARRKKGKRRKR